MFELVATDEFETWYEALSEADAVRVTRAVALLESMGVEQPRVRSIPVSPMLMRGRLSRLDARPLTLYELTVEDGGFHVLFATEGEQVVVLLYAYSDDESVTPTPAAAHVLLAAKVYFQYRAGKEATG